MINFKRYLTARLILAMGVTSCGGPQTQFTEAPESPKDKVEGSADAELKTYFLKEWEIGTPKDQTVIIETGFGLVSQNLSLFQEPLTQEQATQLDRPPRNVALQQGHNGDSQTDNFAVSEAGLLDLLIVMDDSSSMDQYQDRISDNLSSLLAHIGNTNWRIAVTSTSSSCKIETGQTSEGDINRVEILTKAIYDNDPAQAQGILNRLLKKSTLMYQEEGIRTGTDALQGICNGVTTPWLRPSANISMLIITDEENCGSGRGEPGCAGMPYETASYFTDVYGTEPTVHGLLLLNDPPISAVECEDSGYNDDPPNPVNYIDLITQTGGEYADICTADYSTVLEQISQNVGNKINVQFELNYAPSEPNNLTIEIDGNPVADYTVDGRTLTINEAVAPTANDLSAQYLHSPEPITSSFSLGEAADPTTLSIQIDGAPVASDSYSYDNATYTVTFHAEPAHRADINFNFRPDTALPTEFNINNTFIENTVEVYINGAKNSNFSVVNNRVVFDEAPEDGAIIDIAYALPGDKKSEYNPLEDVDLESLEDVRVLDKDTFEEVPVEITEGGKLSFPETEVWNERGLIVEYNREIDPKNLNFSLPIEHQLVDDSLKIIADGDENVCFQSLKVTDKDLSFFCSDEDFETLEIHYQELVDFENSFTLDFDYTGPVQWKVFINELEFENFHQIENTIVVLKKDLPTGSKVRIEAHPLK